MARSRSSPNKSANSSANIGFEAKLWLAADKLRSNMDAAEYKHVVLGLIFLKYISDSFEIGHCAKAPAPRSKFWLSESFENTATHLTCKTKRQS